MLIRVALIAAGCLAYFVSLPPSWVEVRYSRGLYAALQPALTSASNAVPIALFDPLILVAVVVALFAARGVVHRMRATRTWKPAAVAALNCAATVSVVYLIFLACWGLNYERVPLAERLVADTKGVNGKAVLALAHRAVSELNGLHGKAHAEQLQSWDEVKTYLEPAYAKTFSVFVPDRQVIAGLPKWSLFTYYFERAGISGMTDPFFLEILVDRGLLPFERPFVVAHEWAHLGGYADEAEANFAGWVTCMNGGAFAQYSGWLFMYGEAASALPRAERSEVAKALGPGVREDLAAIAARERRIHPMLQSASWRIYDRYLKANRVEEGVASYDRVLVLILQTKFRPGWMPVLKPSA